MIRIRVAEETVGRYYPEQEMRTPTHFSIGQEAISVGVCQALEQTDAAFSGHRCHAEYLAKGGSLLGMFAELYGRVDGCCKGRGGSVHLNDPSVGMIASSAILGEMIAAGVGAAWAFKMDGSDRVAVTFFGDGVTEEGIMHESLNFASVMNVPVLFVCANNGLSTNTPLSVRQPRGHQIWKWAAGYNIASEHVDGSDVFAVHKAALRAVAHLRAGKGPYFIEAPYYRTRVHVGYETDEMKNYLFRSKETVEAGKALDPVLKATRKMIADGICTQAEVDEWTAAMVREVEDVVVQAKASPFPTVDQLLVGAY
ncbi:MAG: thiamine pyrophosphate-dependent dehydrogenase E1 component subunit alpha [Chloroflexi bacterium]|nr:thiamine pyrophosphate-dependent dehydrogenase E1 component subunit alpha [Chloroflexota bacterium]